MNKAIMAFSIIFLIFAAGCTGKNADTDSSPEPAPVQYDAQAQAIISKCEKLCQQNINEGKGLTAGPCLSNEIEKDWVCDVAHSPRQEIDNLPENQCLMYRGGAARHFVEADENCNVIRAV